MYLLPPQAQNDYVEVMLLLRAFPVDGTRLFASSCRIAKSVLSLDNLQSPLGCRAQTQMFVGLFEVNYNVGNGLNHSALQSVCNWTLPQMTSIPDAPARTCVAAMPTDNVVGGGVYLLGNQIGNTQFEDRKVLTLSITDRSGLFFNFVYALRYNPPEIRYAGNGKMPEFAYPAAMWRDGKMYVVYD